MNARLMAAALHALANALETPADAAHAPSSPAPSAPPQEAVADVAAPAKKRGPGRPAKGEEGSAPAVAATPTPAVAAPTAAPATSTTPAASATLTHAGVANDFKDAAAKHGIEFVKGLLKQFAKGATFDTVPVALLGNMQTALRAGPAPKAETAADLLG